MRNQPTTERIEVIKAVMAAWARHDIDQMLAHMAPNVEWHYQVGSRPVNGVDNMRKVLSRLKDHQLDSNWRLIDHASSGDTVMIEAVDDYRNPAGHRVQVPYMGVYSFDGMRITGWRDYVDLGLMMKAEDGEPPPEWLVPLVERGYQP